MKKQTDRRQYRRFKVKTDLTVEINNEVTSKFGRVLDISRGGLSFRYPDLQCHENGRSEIFRLNIFNSSKELLLSGAFCKIIENRFSPSEYSFSLLPMNKCRVQFEDMTPSQSSKLEQYISNLSMN